MKSSDLHNLWTAPDNSRLTSKQYSFRLPVHVAAKLATLVEMFPNKSRTEIVGDLLSTAITEAVNGFPYIQGEYIGQDPSTGEQLYDDMGKAAQFWKIANRYYKELEKEMGNENPPDIFSSTKPKVEDQE